MSYIVVEHNSNRYLVAEKRLGEFIARVGGGKKDSFKTLMVLDGSQLEGMTCKHPLTGLELALVE